jgi:uncharacterized protein
MNKLIIIPIFALVFILLDLYAFQALKVVIENLTEPWKRSLTIIYWSVTAITILGFFAYHFSPVDSIGKGFWTFVLVGIFMNYFSKFFGILFLLVDDFSRAGQWVVQLFKNPDPSMEGDSITRSQFLAKGALIASAVPFVSMSYGILSGAHDYRIRRVKLNIPHLPKEFSGMKLAQLSDIHSGSFFNKTAVKGGVEMVMKEKPDMIFFTGDLVNNVADEVKDYVPIFDKLKAPYGVYSTLGNHDYGEYVSWPSQEARLKNLDKLKDAHNEMGWKLMMNENKIIEEGGEKLAILGVENWGTGRWPKYGKLDEAYAGSEEAAYKILLSHDPSHWDGQVREMYPDIDLMLAGHTHGFQFGVEIAGFQWSPAQYAYKQWAGLYTEGKQQLYVNRGFGYLGFPGRVGMPPEITIIELGKA